MDPTAKFMNVDKLQAELESFARKIEVNISIDASAMFNEAKALLSKVNECPGEVSGALGTNLADQAKNWQAMHDGRESGEQNVICWRHQPDMEALIEGTWQGSPGPDSKLLLLKVLVGDRSWAMRDTENGPFFFGFEGAIEGPGHEAFVAVLQHRAEKILRERPVSLSFVTDWTCSRCNWPNQAGSVCQMCRTPRIAAGASSGVTSTGKGGLRAAPLHSLFDPGPEYEGLPLGLDPRAKLDNELDLPPGLQELAGELTRWSYKAIKLILADKGKQQPHCVKCGAQISTSSRFCTKCGAEQHPNTMTGPETLIERVPASRASASKASNASWQCSRCHQANPKQAKFCMNCAAPAPLS
jgi:zinc-ribbon domain